MAAAFNERNGLDRGLGGDFSGDDEGLDSGICGSRQDAADHFAGERSLVEATLAGDHEIRFLEALVEAEPVRHEIEAGDEPSTDRREAAGEASCGARAREVGYGELREPLAQNAHLLRRCSLLRREDVCGVEKARLHVAGHVEWR